MARRTFLVAIDESPQALEAAKWVVAALCRPGDRVELVAVTPPPAMAVSPPVPMATAGAVTAITTNWELQRKADEERARKLLKDAAAALRGVKAPEHLSVHEHLLPAAGGASGVAESLVACAKEKKADLLVLGSRGMGATKRTLMSMVGLGSVSDYCVHNAPCPVAVVRAEGDAAATAAAVPTAAERKEGHKVLVSIDDSQLAKKALAWALHHCMVHPQDELHLVCVALPIPYPIVHEDAVEAAPLQSEEAEEATAESLRYAREVVEAAVDAAVADQQQQVKAWEGRLRGSSGGPGSPGAAHAGGAAAVAAVAPHDPPSHHNGASWRPSLSDVPEIDKSRIFFKALYPEGGASDVGESIVHYAKANKVDLLVVGARGMGAIKRAVMSFVGLGSVSDYCVHNSACPVVIVKE